jgi:uncharacterized protein (DUF927 family)
LYVVAKTRDAQSGEWGLLLEWQDDDGLLILDELSQIDPREAGEATYLLANGPGKTRASRTGTVRQSSRWSLFFLSAGEESLMALMAKSGRLFIFGVQLLQKLHSL